MEALGHVPRPVLAGAALLVGLAVGSFLNVVIARLPNNESIVKPRSKCPGCKINIKQEINPETACFHGN